MDPRMPQLERHHHFEVRARHGANIDSVSVGRHARIGERQGQGPGRLDLLDVKKGNGRWTTGNPGNEWRTVGKNYETFTLRKAGGGNDPEDNPRRVCFSVRIQLRNPATTIIIDPMYDEMP